MAHPPKADIQNTYLRKSWAYIITYHSIFFHVAIPKLIEWDHIIMKIVQFDNNTQAALGERIKSQICTSPPHSQKSMFHMQLKCLYARAYLRASLFCLYEEHIKRCLECHWRATRSEIN